MRLLSLVLSGVFLAACGKADDQAVIVTPLPSSDTPLESALKAIASGEAVLLDVRSQGERDAGYVKDSIFLPITELKADAAKEGFNERIARKVPTGKKVYAH